MNRITERTIDCILAILCALTLVGLMWWLLDQTAYTAENPRYERCLTEDQTGWCIWEGKLRYFEDPTDIVQA